MNRINNIKITALILCILTVFSGCSVLETQEAKYKYKIENDEAILTLAPNKSTVTEITIPDEYEGKPVTIIKDFSASNLENAEKITIGKNVREIGLWAFENNQKLKEFEVSGENEYFCDVDGVLYTKDMKTLLFFPAVKDLKTETVTDDIGNTKEIIYNEYEIPDGVETVRTKAFYKCQKIRFVTIPSSVKTIEEKAFFRCSSLENIVLPESLELIGKDAFSYCSKFTEITIPEKVAKIETYAFYNCKNLHKITISAPEDSIVLEEKWQPTDNGKKISEVEIIYN